MLTLSRLKLHPKPIKNLKVASNLEEYKKVAAELGFTPAQLKDVELNNILIQNRIPIFDYEQVHRYMISICPKRKVYVWKHLTGTNRGVGYPENHGELSGQRYERLVPLHILQRVKTVMGLFPEEGSIPDIGVYVSDYEATRPDPFVMITYNSRAKRFVIGCWDEPGFEGKPEV